MKRILYLISILLLGVFCLGFCACNNNETPVTPTPVTDPNGSDVIGTVAPLASPIVYRQDAESDLSSLTFAWDAVQNAEKYEVLLSVNQNVKYSEDIEDGLTTFSLDEKYIDELGDYVISVFAKDTDLEYSPSVGTYVLHVTLGSLEKFPIEISSTDQFFAIDAMPDGFYCLTSDLDFSEVLFNPLCTENNAFAGTLDGNGYALKNINVTTSKSEMKYDAKVGIFASTYNATIKNLKIENFSSVSPESYYTGQEYIGTLAGLCIGGRIENVEVKSSNINWNTYRNLASPVYCVGGLFGLLTEDAYVADCSVNVNIALSTPFNQNFYMNESGIVTSTDNPYAHFSSMFVGGIAGSAQITSELSQNMVIERCSTSGYMAVQGNILGTGGFLGNVLINTNLSQPYQTALYDCRSDCSFILSQEDDFPSGGDFKKHIGLAVGKADYLIMKRCFCSVSVKTKNIDFDDVPTGYIPTVNARALVATYGFVGYGHGESGSAQTSPRPRIFDDCYYDSEKITENEQYFTKIGSWQKSIYQENVIEISGLNKDEYSLKNSFDSFDFENVWDITSKGPVLR